MLRNLSHAEAEVIKFIRKCAGGHSQVAISCLGQRWCVERSDFTVAARPVVCYGNTFDEAWLGVSAMQETSERAVAGVADNGGGR